jgi:hypothetical protein
MTAAGTLPNPDSRAGMKHVTTTSTGTSREPS